MKITNKFVNIKQNLRFNQLGIAQRIYMGTKSKSAQIRQILPINKFTVDFFPENILFKIILNTNIKSFVVAHPDCSDDEIFNACNFPSRYCISAFIVRHKDCFELYFKTINTLGDKQIFEEMLREIIPEKYLIESSRKHSTVI